MIVAVPAVGMVQVAVDDVVAVIAVGDRVVAAPGAVRVLGSVPAARVVWSAVGRVLRADGEGVLVDVAAVRVMQVAVVEEVLVTLVVDGLVAAAVAVDVVVSCVGLVVAHGASEADGCVVVWLRGGVIAWWCDCGTRVTCLGGRHSSWSWSCAEGSAACSIALRKSETMWLSANP